MERAILVRHAESEFSVRAAVCGDPTIPCALTATGREQALRLGELLAGEAFDLCITSEFQRAIETSDIALAGRDVPRLVLPELNDPRAGDFEGGPLEDYRAWAHGHGPLDEPPGGGESRAAVALRLARAARTIVARPERTILVVAHSLPLAYLLNAARGRNPSAAVEVLGYAQPYPLSPAELERAADGLEAWCRDPVFA